MNSQIPEQKHLRQPGANVLHCIGNTPMLELYFPEEAVTIYAKAEFMNPSGSIKDRLASYVLEHAVESGALRPESIILECTSGNTGISMAMVGAAMGFRVKILMSELASIERQYLIRHFGAEVQTFTASNGYATGIEISRSLAQEDPRIFLPMQFENPLNAEDHVVNTVPEILQQMKGKTIDAFVSGFGTGGTINGCGTGLKRENPKTQVIAMEPSEAAMLSGESPCCHFIEGISGGYIPPLIKDAPIDGIEKISSEEALHMTRRLSREHGLLVGFSAGANVAAALKVAMRLGPDAHVVTILCDRAERYYSTRLFEEDSVQPLKFIP